MGDFFVTDILRTISFVIDRIIYGFIEDVYALFLEIANTTIFSNEVLDEFAGKVYALLGIFMLFKVSFSVLSYIVNPDEFTDKNKGVSKLITNVLVSLVLIIVVPMIFTEAMEIQQIILKDDVIPKLFSSPNIYVSSQDPTDGSQMAKLTFEAFYIPEASFESLDDIFNDDVNRRNATETDYAVKYSFFLSSIVGFIVALLLVSFCFDIALRSIKIGFLRMIAPIPIISRIDPKKGNEVFNKWVKTCLSTYLDLFIRLAGIFFAIYIIKLINQSGYVDAITGESTEPSSLVKVFILIGALMFAKHLPKLIKDITGFDMGGGSFTLNPFKKISQVPLLGAGLSAGAALAGGAIAGGKAGHEAGHTMRGAIQGAWGAASGLKGKVSMAGADGKNMVGIGAGWQAGYKSITGKDYAVFNPLKYDMFHHGRDEVQNYKDAKNALLGQQSELDAKLQNLYKEYQAIPETDTISRTNKMNEITANRAAYGKIGKHISTLDDQISDIKRIYKFDDSTRGDVADALAAAAASLSSSATSGGRSSGSGGTSGTSGGYSSGSGGTSGTSGGSNGGSGGTSGTSGGYSGGSGGTSRTSGGQGQSGNQQGRYGQSQYSTTNSGHYTANPEDGADSFWE